MTMSSIYLYSSIHSILYRLTGFSAITPSSSYSMFVCLFLKSKQHITGKLHVRIQTMLEPFVARSQVSKIGQALQAGMIYSLPCQSE